MHKLFTIAAATLIAGTAHAADLSGEVELTFSEKANDKWGGEMSLDLGVDAGVGAIDLDFVAVDGGAVTLDNWTVGTTLGGVDVAIGDDNGVFVGAEGEQTIAAPAMAESLKITVGDAHVAVGFTDWGSDISDISNIQGAYTMGVAGLEVTASGDYNLDTETTVLGGTVGGINLGAATLGGTVTYDVDAEHFAFEGVAKAGGIVAYLNGDETDSLQHIGGEYEYALGAGASLTAGTSYNLDKEEWTPSVSVGFAF